MSKKRKLNEDLSLIATIIQDQLNMIDSRLEIIESSDDPGDALKTAVSTLVEVKESCTLTGALVGHIKDDGNGAVES